MTDISFLTESVTEEERCCKEIVVIDLPECCLGTEFNLLTAAAYYEGVLDVAGASGMTATRALALSHTQEAPYAGRPLQHQRLRMGFTQAGQKRVMTTSKMGSAETRTGTAHSPTARKIARRSVVSVLVGKPV